MDMKELRKNAEKVIAERFPDFNFSTLDWGELDPLFPYTTLFRSVCAYGK